VAALGHRGQHRTGAVGRIAQHLDRAGFVGRQLDADRGVGVLASEYCGPAAGVSAHPVMIPVSGSTCTCAV
jgi:hypothetical protein